nr:MAG TPA: hypothetical protein [Caudoviricetes sp.]
MLFKILSTINIAIAYFIDFKNFKFIQFPRGYL